MTLSRSLYRGLLRLHPEPFRRRYGEEMLWIFDDAEGPAPRLRLLADCILSLGRQRALRSAHWGETVTPPRSADGTPSFYLVEARWPSVEVLLNGVILAGFSFAAAGVIIAHGGPSGVMQLPRVEMRSSNVAPPRVTSGVAARKQAEAAATDDIVLSFAALDSNGDGLIDRAESDPKAAERLRAILACAGLDGDGEIRFAEFLRAVKLGEADCAERLK